LQGGRADDVIVGHEHADDAAVVRALDNESRNLVLTADVIAPIVDDPYDFGRIAATNSLSDIYAMGGTPRFALNLAFFPSDDLPVEVLERILKGGSDTCAAAGVAIVGGHTVRDKELKYGLSVTGEVDAQHVLSNKKGTAGERLVLTKALGTGVLGTAIKGGIASSEEHRAAVDSMTLSNAAAMRAALQHGVRCATDVTGFGLLGHLRNILRASNLGAEIKLSDLPLLPGALEHAAAGKVPGGSKANQSFLKPSRDLLATGCLAAEIGVLDASDTIRLLP
jgi:selenide,water dikinase